MELLQVVPMTPDYIVTLLGPIVVFLATAAARWALPKIPGIYVVGLMVPALSFVVAWIGTLIDPAANFWIQVLVSFGATWVREFITQLKSGTTEP